MFSRLYCLFFLFSLANQFVYAQQSTRAISGIVTTQESAPLEGVTVSIKGTEKVSGSHPDGIYYIAVTDKDSILVFSYQEFQTQEIKLSASGEYNVVLRRKLPNTVTKESFSPAGKWRGLFQLRPQVEVPFNFVIEEEKKEGLKLYFLNGEEKFEAGPVRQIGDSLFIALDPFDNELVLQVNSAGLNGILRRQDKTGTPLHLKAEKNKNHRFVESGTAPAGDISGTYDIVFKLDGGKDEKAVGLFTQKGKQLKATFLRVTGDSRYLEGMVEGNHFYLSSFIGSSPAYYKGSFTDKGEITGQVIGVRGSADFSGTPNEDAALPDLHKLTFLKKGYPSFDFSFPDVNGKKISLQDTRFKNKVVIITITGTWCPNCVDEASFLAPWYKANRDRGIEAIAIHYERQTDTAFVRKALTRFRNRFDIQYYQVIAGRADKQFVAESLPSLNTFLAFPTTIIIDRTGKVAGIHTGYSGPATGKYYAQFVKEFNEQIDSLVEKRGN